MKPLRERAEGEHPHASLARLCEAAAEAVWLLGIDGRVMILNHGARLLFPDAMNPGDHWSAAWPQDSRPTMERAMSGAAAGQRQGFRFQYSTSDGVRKYMDFTISPVFDEDGGLEHLMAQARDVTDQIESRAFINAVLDALPQALTVHDLRSREIVLCNASAEDFPARLAGKDTRSAPIRPWSSENDQAVAHARRVVRTEIIETPQGPRCISTLKIATYDDSGARHLITLSEDITEERSDREAAERALHAAKVADQTKSLFLTNMNHELRTPLNGVVAGLDALRQRLDQNEHADLVEMIWTSAVSLAARIDELSAARPDAPPQDLKSETFDLAEAMQQAIAPFKAKGRDKGLSLRILISNVIPERVAADRSCLISALRPLLDNGVKFTDVGEVVLEITQPGAGWLRFSVHDSGIGFDPAVKDQIFTPFVRQDQSLTRRFGGLGLGLSSARVLAERMGGRVDADARPGGGSTFWIDLPISAAPALCAPDSSSPADVQPLRILIADDHPTNRRVLKLILGEISDVTAVVNGREAVEAARASSFDVVLMDIQMPVMDGITAVERIRRIERDEGRAPVPIIMLTANTEDEHVRASRAAGADRHMAKPFTAKSLIEAIDGVRRQTPHVQSGPHAALA